MRIVLALVLLFLSSCREIAPAERRERQHAQDLGADMAARYRMICSENLDRYHYAIFRCENDEIICYLGDSKAQCKFKGDH